MPDYNLGRAHGQIAIDYDGTGPDRAVVDLDRVSKASAEADASLQKTNKTVDDSGKQFESSGSSAEGFSTRLKDVRSASEEVNKAEKDYKKTLLDSKATLHDVEVAHQRVTTAQKDHIKATNAARDAQKAWSESASVGERAARALQQVIPNLSNSISQLATVQEDAERKSTALARGLTGLVKAIGLLGPEAQIAAGGLELTAKGVDKLSSGVSAGSGHIRDFIKDIAGFESAFGKIAGLSLAVPSVGGLATIGGAAGVQGIVEVVESVRQLAGGLALLPAVVGGAGVVMGTLKVALHGVDSALKDIFADDPKKFLEDIKNMGPAAAHGMLQVAQFRNQFLMGGAAVQDSFFSKINADIAPLIQTWLPALVSAGSKIAGVLGSVADEFAKILMQPQTMAAFNMFIDNVAKGLQSMEPALKPLMSIFTQLSAAGSTFFAQIGQGLTGFLTVVSGKVGDALASGKFDSWVETSLNAFSKLVDAAMQFGEAFGNIMDAADAAGDGGLLGLIDKVATSLNNWTNSTAGQQAITTFFTTLKTATDAFLPVLGPLLDGIVSIASAFTQLGVATAPEWVKFFQDFAYEMANDLGPAIQGMGPAIGTFLTGMTDSFRQLMQTVGPQLPQIFQDLANAFVALLPQIPQMAAIFADLVRNVGPQLPQLFQTVSEAIGQLVPLMPQIIELTREFVSVVTLLVRILGGLISGVKDVNDAIGKDLPNAIKGIVDTIGHYFDNLPDTAKGWGKALVDGLISGIEDTTGIGALGHALAGVMGGMADWFQHSPAKKGPFSGDGYTMVRGRKMVTDMASGMASAQPAIVSAAAKTAQAASGALAAGTTGAGGSGGGAGAAGAGGGATSGPAAGGAGTEGGSLQPDWIRHADTSVLDSYLKHQFPKNRGLAGFAKDMGALLSAAQSGVNLMFQHVLQPLGQVLQMQVPGADGKNSPLFPSLNTQTWRKMSPQAAQEQALQELQRKALQGNQGPTWGSVLGGGSGDVGQLNPQIPLGLGAGSSKEDIQKAIIAAGRGRGMNDAAIQTALAVAAAESGFNPTISGGVQGSAGLVSGLFQQSPSSGWGSLDQVNDPNHAINAFYDAFAQQLAKNPTNPLLAAVLTQNPQLGSGAQGSAYWNAVSSKVGLGGQILTQLGPGVKGPSWQQLTGGGVVGPGAAPTVLPPGVHIGHDGSLSFPEGTTLPPGIPQRFPAGTTVGPSGAVIPPSTTVGATGPAPAGPGGIGLNPASRAATLGGGSVTYTPDLLEQHGIKPLFQKSTGDAAGGKEIPGWVQQLGAAFGLTPTDHPDDTLHGGQAGPGNRTNPMGSYAFDFSGSTDNMNRFAQFIMTNLAGQTLQLIHQGGGRNFGIAGGQDVSSGNYYAADYGGHGDHVHWATDVPVLFNGQVPPGSMTTMPLAPGAPGATTSPQAAAALAAGYPDVAGALGQIQDNTGQNKSINDKLLQAYLQGNPNLAAQIGAARAPGAPDQVVQSALGNISTTISTLKSQDSIGNKNTIDALSSAQTQIAQQQGFQQSQSPAQMFSSVVGGASNIASSVIQTIQSGLDALTATQDLADRAVYGTRNTEDVMKQIDDVQKYITLAANIANTTGQILSTVGGIAGASGGMDMGASSAISAAGQIAQLISGALQGVNAGIDFAQQLWHIAGTYIGRGMSQLLAGAGGTPLLGDVREELDTNTGQLISYSADNPELKNYLTVPSGLNRTYPYGGGSEPNPQTSNQFNLYAGPGTGPGELLNAATWMVNTGGTTGAMAASNF